MCALCASLLERARDAGVSVEWHTGAPSELVAYVPVSDVTSSDDFHSFRLTRVFDCVCMCAASRDSNR